MSELEKLIIKWKDSKAQTKKAFMIIMDYIIKMKDISFEFKARPKISYSLRLKHKNQKNRSFFAIIDIIDDEPNQRWLSICFYEDMINDPKDLGDMIPQGMMGEDGYCFDFYEYNEKNIEYIKKRFDQAYLSASNS
ncbi:MAG: hypothetical protein B6I26_04695 [Desulfobacteraceae bacterium 4572_130]|nr:MAG: hypothetical protein B6I26_04695 [Desulfobacteraceae bacterium 4572_130]